MMLGDIIPVMVGEQACHAKVIAIHADGVRVLAEYIDGPKDMCQVEINTSEQ